MFAVSIAAADSSINHLSKIVFENIDTSPAMTKIGERVWDEFVAVMRNRNPNHPLCKVFDIIVYQIHTRSNTIGNQLENKQCYVFGTHCVYDDTIDELEDEFNSLYSRFNPTGVFLTTHSKKKSLLDRVSSIDRISSYVSIPDDTVIPAQFNDHLARTTEWRKLVVYRLFENLSVLINSGIDTDLLSKYLQRIVKWKYNMFAFKVIVRRDIDQIPNKNDIDDFLPF